MGAYLDKNATEAKCWGNAISVGATKRFNSCALGKCAVAAKRDKNATAAKCWGNALSAVAAKRQKFATDDKGFGNAQWLFNTKNT